MKEKELCSRCGEVSNCYKRHETSIKRLNKKQRPKSVLFVFIKIRDSPTLFLSAEDFASRVKEQIIARNGKATYSLFLPLRFSDKIKTSRERDQYMSFSTVITKFTIYISVHASGKGTYRILWPQFVTDARFFHFPMLFLIDVLIARANRCSRCE